jgi:hypothetical protein
MAVIPAKVKLLDASGKGVYVAPSPNEQIEKRVNAELAQSFDPLLHIRWIKTAYWNEREKAWEGRYALCSSWPQNDKRWELVQQHKMPASDAFDLFGWFCSDIHDASSVPSSPESMWNRIVELIGSMDNTRYPWRKRMLDNIQHNKEQKQKHKQEALEEVADEASTAFYHTSRATRVFT